MSDYLSAYKKSGLTGWVLYYGTEDSMRTASRGLAEAGVSSEMRHSEKGVYPYWLVVGIPSNEADDVVMPLLNCGQFQLGLESEFLRYRDVAADSELIMTVEERALHQKKSEIAREEEIGKEEEEKRAAEAELLEELRRNQIKDERAREKVCIMCGKPLGFSQKLFVAKTHKRCTRFTEERSYIDNGDGTVTDQATGLMWTKKAMHGCMSWEKAVQYCANFKLAGYSDWRLPAVDNYGGRAELDTLFRKGGKPSGEWQGIGGTPFVGVRDYFYWSGTSRAGSTGHAWSVNMDFGYENYYLKDYDFYVWPVRGGQ